MTAYYNEIETYPAQWLRNLIAAGHIAPGDVDERSIVDVQADDLRGYTQCHFFAGLGGWSYALRLAGWADDRSVWTGSCPCQPFSSAGDRKGFADHHHLWPVWKRLVSKCAPVVIFGEQVASEDGLVWFDAVSADLERENFACAAFDLSAAGFGAPHIRQRLFWVADATSGGCGKFRGEMEQEGWCLRHPDGGIDASCDVRLGDTRGPRLPNAELDLLEGSGRRLQGRAIKQSGGSFWADADWLECRDSRYRPVEPGTFPLADGILARTGRLRAYGNAIVPQAAAEVIAAYMECRP